MLVVQVKRPILATSFTWNETRYLADLCDVVLKQI